MPIKTWCVCYLAVLSGITLLFAFFPLWTSLSLFLLHARTHARTHAHTHTHTEQHVSAPLTQTHTQTHALLPYCTACSITFPSLFFSLSVSLPHRFLAVDSIPPLCKQETGVRSGPGRATSRQGFLPSVYLACYRSADVYLQEWIQDPDTP